MSNIDLVLNLLSGVKNVRNREFSALCPVHNEKTPSLRIKELDGERIIMHCFGCGANGIAVIDALGLDASVLFPPRPKNERGGFKRERITFPAHDILKSIRHESTIVMLAASDILNGVAVSKADFSRIELAYNRLSAAVQCANQ